MCDCPLIIFAKAPVPGDVKTRLIPALSPRGAAALHRALVRDILRKAVEADVGPVELHCSPSAEHPFFRDCAHRFRVALRTQLGDDLGARMERAFGMALASAPYALLAGADCPALTIGDIRMAAQRLREGTDAVLVPAEDGGYTLLGLRRAVPALFTGISWGGAGVMAETRGRLKVLAWRWAELPAHWDVDRPEDLLRLGTLNRPEFSRFVKPSTP